jgi:hypothetical protein
MTSLSHPPAGGQVGILRGLGAPQSIPVRVRLAQTGPIDPGRFMHACG